MTRIATHTLLSLTGGLILAALPAHAEEMLKVKKSTFVNLVDLLVQRGVINKQEGEGLVSGAQQEAAEAEAETAAKAGAGSAGGTNVGDSNASAPNPASGASTGAGKPAASAAAEAAGKSKHVGYVPEFVKNEIREQLRKELKGEVVSEVKQDAKNEGWGVPGALPDWVRDINPTFDMRLRYSNNFFAPDNQTGPSIGPFNYLQINQDGGFKNALARNLTDAYINNTKNGMLLRERFRLSFETQINDSIKTGVRLATSNNYSPVSNDQTLGNTGQSYQFAIDRAFIQYDYNDANNVNWFSFYGGRTINPFVSSDVVFDPDLSFEGVTTSFRYHMNQNDARILGYRPPLPTARYGVNQGQQSPDSVFLTLGVYPIQNVNFSSESKWLYAGQLGTDLLIGENSRLNFAGSYYEYQNISARYNSANGNGHENDWTAPQFLQGGNSMVAITDSNSGGGQVCSDPKGCLFGLASGFKILNFTGIYDWTAFGDKHVMFTADYAQNLGFNKQQILSEFHQSITPRTMAYQLRFDIGAMQIQRSGQWSVNFAYRYIQRDAVLDAFTDSIFHLGGTNAKGWVLGGQYGVAKNTWLNLNWFSSDAIDGPKYAVDTLNLDLNTRY